MFVRQKANKSGSVSVQVIDKSDGYRVVKTIGTVRDLVEVARLVELGEVFIKQQSGQYDLFPEDQHDNAVILDFVETLGNERHEVNEALLAYARREGLEVIVGSTHEGRISDKTTIHLPTKSGECERYEDLENKLRRGRHWPEVSKMDVFMLQRIWSGKAEDPGRIRTILKPFVSETQETSIYIRRKKS